MSKSLTTTLHHLTDLRFVAESPEGQRTMIDNEKHARTGMSPMQLLLSATAACSAMDLVVMLRKRRLTVKGYRVEMVGERPDAVPSPFTRVTARHILNVPGLDEDTANRFVEMATHKYCSVGASLKAELDYEVVLEHDTTPELTA